MHLESRQETLVLHAACLAFDSFNFAKLELRCSSIIHFITEWRVGLILLQDVLQIALWAHVLRCRGPVQRLPLRLLHNAQMKLQHGGWTDSGQDF